MMGHTIANVQTWLWIACSVSITACYSGLQAGDVDAGDAAADAGAGTAASGDAGDAGEGDSGDHEVPATPSHSGLRRLSVAEYDNAVRDLLGDDARAGAQLLPDDALGPFDNQYDAQSPSEALIVSAEKLATDAANRLLNDAARLESLAGCAPAGPDDDACLRKFIESLGRRAFRRPLTAEEIEALAALGALGVEAGSWHVGAAAVVRVLLQDVNFWYRSEIGEPVDGAPGTFKLTDWEVATRLSLLLWSTVPDDDLLDVAAADGLSTRADVRKQAERMLDDPRAREGVKRLHELWLGYSRLGKDGLSGDMRQESNALVERVVFDEAQPWLSMFTSSETFISPALAEHYGLPAPDATDPGWVEYGESGRGGIISHGTVLAWGAKFGDTSPTVRGKQVRERLFCQPIPDPPPGENVDDPPGGDNPDACKIENYAEYRKGGCNTCHGLMDGIGFGLENYSADGSWRAHDVDKPNCTIAGDGEIAGVGAFNGPAQLGELMAESTEARACAALQLYRFASGRREPDELDAAALSALAEQGAGEAVELKRLLADLAESDAFRFRVVEHE